MTDHDGSGTMAVSVENVGGIGKQEQAIEPGVTILTGRNATNRTSLLRAIGAGLGGSSGELKADAEAGSVQLSVDSEQFTRSFTRDGQSIGVGGDPYTADGDVVDRYSCLLADNPARQAVERGDSDALREFIMAPLDTDEIRATIERTQRSIRSLREELAEAERQREQLPALERELDERRDELDDVRAQLQSVRSEVTEYEADADAAEEAEAVVEDLKEARGEYERVRNRLETQRKALGSLEEQREDIRAELSEMDQPETGRSSVQSELQRLQQRERSLASTVNSLLSIIEFNEELLSEDDLAGVEVDGDVAAALDPETQTVRCWTCGTGVERRAIDDRLDDLREVVDEKRRERNELRTDIDELRSELRALRSTAQERESLESRIDDVEAEIDERTDRIERLEERQSELETRIEELEAKAAESGDLRDSDLLERYQRLSELEYERGQLEERIESLESELESVREEADRVEAIEAELEDRESELASARNRIGDLEQSAADTFNDHMETVLDLLAYENVARVWIERKNGSAVDQTVAESSFELHVVRSTADGAVYEDRVGHLSESEREVIGLVVALAGYLVHDVHESVPVMLLDSLESIDADRIAALIDYFSDFVPYLVVALLPEDASALPDEHARIRMGEALG